MSESVIGITLNEDRTEVLLIKRRDVPVWTLPGGGKEPSEAYEEAVIREIHEETGYHVQIFRKAAFYTPINQLAQPTHVFECRVVNGQATTSEETLEVAFFPIQKLPSSFFEVHRDWLNDTLTNPHQIVLKRIEQVSYFAVCKYFFKHPIRVIRALLARLGIPWNSHL